MTSRSEIDDIIITVCGEPDKMRAMLDEETGRFDPAASVAQHGSCGK